MKGKTMIKLQCNGVIYEILSIEDPQKYPKIPMNTSVSSITPDGGSCIVTDDPDDPDDPEPFSYTLQDCDCSDPKNYDFYDKGRF